MPLLGRKPFPRCTSSKDLKQDDKIYTIKHTGERFSSQKEYERRLALYKEKLWTCQCTGHINMSHEQALKSEQKCYKIIQQHMKEFYEKPILQLTHHSSEPLDNIVDRSWYQLQTEMVPGDEVEFADNEVEGVIISVDKSGYVPQSEVNSSDKENSTPTKDGGKSTPLKRPIPTLLPFRYSVKILDDNKIVNDVPADSLLRVNRPPSKELIKLFIRGFALRTGDKYAGPWIVDGPMVSKYKLAPKIHDLFLSPAKISDVISKADALTAKKMKKKASAKSKSPVKSGKDGTKVASTKGNANKRKLSSTNGSSPSKKKAKTETQPESRPGDDSETDTDAVVLEKLKKSPNKSSKNDAKKGKLKQMSLLDMKGSGLKKASGSPVKKKPAHTGIILYLQKLIKKGAAQKTLNKSAKQAAAVMTEKGIGRLPVDVRPIVKKFFDRLQEEKKLSGMTEEEREVYLKEKRMQKLLDKRTKKEDQDLTGGLKLPTPKLVPTPEPLPNESFGDIAFVLEFLACYKHLLIPEDGSLQCPISSELLMMALVSGKEGFGYIGTILCVLLQTWLQDPNSDVKELSVRLSDIVVNRYTVSELLWLMMRPRRQENSSDTDDSEYSSQSNNTDNYPPELIEALEDLREKAVYELSAKQQLLLLVTLCQCLLQSDTLQDYIAEVQQDTTALWRNKQATHAEEKKRKQELKDREKDNDTGEINGSEGEEEGAEDLASVVKRRRIMAAKQAEQKKKREEEDKVRRAEFQRMKELEQNERKFKEGVELGRRVLRRTPLGTDRNHSRYWILHASTMPGLLVEKGWAPSEMTYCTQQKPEVKAETGSDSDDMILSEVSKLNKNEEQHKANKFEKTAPQPGQNLWFVYDAVDEIESLIDALREEGARECALRQELKRRFDDLKTVMKQAQKEPVQFEEPECIDPLEGFKKELSETQARMVAGALSSVDSSDIWTKRLERASTVAQLGELLIETEAHVLPKFLQSPLGVADKKKRNKPYTSEEPQEPSEQAQAEAARALELWCDAVRGCDTMSRMHVLLGVLDSCIAWEKSSENQKCKVCRRKQDDSRAMILCDECNSPYHMMCLRPALQDVPEGIWLCPGCQPALARESRRRKVNYVDHDSEDDDPQNSSGDQLSDQVVEHEDVCTVCGTDGDLAECATCPQVFHADCHEPPLRRIPRGPWRCEACQSGAVVRKQSSHGRGRGRTSGRGKGRSRRAQPKSKVESEDDDGGENESSANESHSEEEASSNSDESGPVKPRASRGRPGRGRGRPTTRGRRPGSGKRKNNTDSESEGEATSRGRRVKRVKYNDSSESEEEVVNRRGKRPKCNNSSNESEDGGGSSRRSGSRPRNRVNYSEMNGDDSDTGRQASAGSKRKALKGSNDTLNVKVCGSILQRLIRNRVSWPFREPVDKEEVPDYYDVIEEPMDFQTMSELLINADYSSNQQFVGHLQLVLDNAHTYNKVGSEIHGLMDQLYNIAQPLVETQLGASLTRPQALPQSGADRRRTL